MKNSFLRFTLIFFLLIQYQNLLFGQSNDAKVIKVDTFQNIVISPNGLSVRKSPSTKSKRIAVIPFGEKVSVLPNQMVKLESLGSYQFNDFTNKIVGQWVKIEYKEIEGYMFNSYLYWTSVPERRYPYLNKNYAILFPGTNCFDNVVYYPDMNYYGIYENEDGQFSFKKVEIGFFTTYSLQEIFLGISTNDNVNLKFIFGSKKRLNPKTLNSKICQFYKNSFFNDEDRSYLKELEPLGITWDKERFNGDSVLRLVYKKDGKTQNLNHSGQSFSYPRELNWIGDLDGDGKEDLIISYGEKNGQTVLYLSSEAMDNEIVRPVAAYFSGYCC